MTREEIYDAEISPLMKQIIAVCKEHDIPLVADFQLDDDRESEDAGFHCTTFIVPHGTAQKMLKAQAILRPVTHEWCAYVEHPDGTREKTAGNIPLPPRPDDTSGGTEHSEGGGDE